MTTPSAGTSSVTCPSAPVVMAAPSPGYSSVKLVDGESVAMVAESAAVWVLTATMYSTFSSRSMRLKA